MKRLFSIFYILLSLNSVRANEFPFQSGEELKFDIRYKYGLVMLKAGTANFKVEESNYKNNHSFLSMLDFKTTSFFDKIFKMRDTLSSYTTENLQPLYHIRSVHEGNYQFKEEIFFNEFSANHTEVRIKRVSQQILRFDTTLMALSMCYDILNIIPILSSLDYSQPEFVHGKTISAFIGREKVTITVRSEGQSVVEKSETLKYKTYKIALDFSDSNFNASKNAIEVWMSDDKNHIPIKIKAKLRIGAAEVYLTSWKNLKYILSSEVKIPVSK